VSVHELRIYRSPSPAHVKRLDEQLAVDGMPMFARNGVRVLDAWTSSLGAPSNRLIYLCEFSDLVARDAAWSAVDRDTRWQEDKVKWSEGLGSLTSELEFWMLEALGTVDLPAGEGASVLLGLGSASSLLPATAGSFRVTLGPVGRRLWLGGADSDISWSTDATGPDDRLMRLHRCGWSPATLEGVHIAA
jgi:NIPSNAP